MKRLVNDVPRWTVYLHRDARGLDLARDKDPPLLKIEDEVFDRIFSGDTEKLSARQRDQKLGGWADNVHETCEQLPAFQRLAAECQGDAMAAGTAVETLMAELKLQVPEERDAKPPENLRRSVGTGCEKASAAVDELRETLEGLADVGLMAGTGTATGGVMSAKSIRDLASRLRSDARLKQIALLAGRFKRIAASKRRQKYRHGADEITDVEIGADLGRLLPSELVKLSHPKLRMAFMRNFVERTAMQYELVGNEPLGKGPLVVLLDKSGSMDGPRDTWATALALALLDQAHRERRTFALICFDYLAKFETIVKPGEPLPEKALFTACAGGTDIATAMVRGLQIIGTNEGAMKKADIVLVTDGGSDAATAPMLRESAKNLGVTVLGLGIGVEREWLVPWCDDIQCIADVSHLDDEAATRLFAA